MSSGEENGNEGNGCVESKAVGSQTGIDFCGDMWLTIQCVTPGKIVSAKIERCMMASKSRKWFFTLHAVLVELFILTVFCIEAWKFLKWLAS